MNTFLNNAPCALLIFIGIAMAEPTLEQLMEQNLSPEERTFFYKTFGNEDNQEGSEEDEQSI